MIHGLSGLKTSVQGAVEYSKQEVGHLRENSPTPQQFWVRKTFSKPASKGPPLFARPLLHPVSLFSSPFHWLHWEDSERLVSLQCIVNATICGLSGNHAVARLTIFGVIIRLCMFLSFNVTQWVSTTVSLANLLWFFLLGSGPFGCLFCCLSNGETQIWLGDLRLALVLLVGVLCYDLPSFMWPPASMSQFSYQLPSLM